MKTPNPHRAEVIEKAINLEWMMNCLISQHYFEQVKMDFLMDFLYDEYCSFALKRRVLGKIFPEFAEGNFAQQMGRLNTIRNCFAHCGQTMGDFKTGMSGVPDPKKPEKYLDFVALHAEFLKLETPVIAALFEKYKAIGGEVIADKPA